MLRYIRFNPTKKTVIATRGKSLLQIGLSAGLKLRHSCANGSCGECRAELVSGLVRQHCHSDFHLNETERSQNMLLMCCHEPDWENGPDTLVINAREQGQAEPIGHQSLTLSVSRFEDAGPDYRLLFCKTPRTQSLRFHAGQSVDLRVRNGEIGQRLTIASCPCDGRFIEFHVKRNEHCEFSGFVFNKLRKGSKLLLEGPYGDDPFLQNKTRPIVFVAYEAGFAAINSLIEHTQALELDDSSQTLFRFSPTGAEPYRANLCHAWEDAFDNFSYVECQESVRDPRQLRHASKSMVKFLNHPFEEADYYLALPQELATTLRDFLVDQGVSTDRIRVLENQ